MADTSIRNGSSDTTSWMKVWFRKLFCQCTPQRIDLQKTVYVTVVYSLPASESIIDTKQECTVAILENSTVGDLIVEACTMFDLPNKSHSIAVVDPSKDTSKPLLLSDPDELALKEYYLCKDPRKHFLLFNKSETNP